MTTNYDPVRNYGEYSSSSARRFISGTRSSIYGTQFVIEQYEQNEEGNRIYPRSNTTARALERQARRGRLNLYVDSVMRDNQSSLDFYRGRWGDALQSSDSLIHSKFLIRDESRIRFDTAPFLNDSSHETIGRDIFYETSNQDIISEARSYFESVRSNTRHSSLNNRYVFTDNDILQRISLDIDSSTGRVIMHSADWNPEENNRQNVLGDSSLPYLLNSLKRAGNRAYVSGKDENFALLNNLLPEANVVRGRRSHYNLTFIEDINNSGEDVFYLSTKRSTSSSIREIALRISSLEDPEAYKYFYRYHTSEGGFDLERAFRQRERRELGFSYSMANLMEDGAILPTSLGGSHFYARAMYNFSMRHSGHHDFIVSNQDASIATAAYKTGYLVNNSEMPTYVPFIYRHFDKELQTQGVGNWVNEYIAIPMGWGRLYKDEIGFIPSILSAFGSALDNTYLYYTGSDPVLGLNSLDQEFNREAAFYNDRSFAQQGIFSTILGEGSSMALTTLSAVALYLTVGEPLSLLMSEAIKENIEGGIRTALSTDPDATSPLVKQAIRQFSLALGEVGGIDLSSDELRRAIIYNLYDRDNTGAVYRNNNEFFAPENFSMSYYHINSVMRRRGQVLIENLAKPFLMDMINPYDMSGDEFYLGKIDNLVDEIGKSIDIKFNFQYSDSNTVGVLLGYRDVVDSYYEQGRRLANKAIDDYENASGVRKQNLKGSADKARKWLDKNQSTRKAMRYLMGEGDSVSDITDYDGNSIKVKNQTISQYRDSNKNDLDSLSSELRQLSIDVINAGEERQMIIARKTQELLDEIPLNPMNWGFIARHRGTLKPYSPIKDFKVVGDILSFEDFTQTMRRLVLGEGGLADFVDKYSVGAIGSEVKPILSVVDRLHSMWNLVTKAPMDAVNSMIERNKFVSKLEKSSKIYKDMEYVLHTRGDIAFADDVSSRLFREKYNQYLDDPTYKNNILIEYRVTSSNESFEDFFQFKARQRVLQELDPYKRAIGGELDGVFTAFTQMDESIQGIAQENPVRFMSDIHTNVRNEAIGILSLTSERTFQKRLAKLNPNSKITKSRILTITFLALAAFTAGESITKSTEGSSLISQVLLALNMGKDNTNTTLDFTGSGPLLPVTGILPRFGYALATTAATAGLSWAIAGAFRTYVPIENTFSSDSIFKLLEANPDIEVSGFGKDGIEIKGRGLNGLAQLKDIDGEFTFSGKLANGQNINTTMTRTGAAGTNIYDFSKKSIYLQGRSTATAAIAFLVISGSVMAAKSTVAWTLNETRKKDKTLTHLAFPVGTAALGAYIGRKTGVGGFALGTAGFIGGSIISAATPSSWLNDFLSLGKGKTDINPTDWLVSAELASFTSLVKERVRRGESSRVEMMAGVYAQIYSDFMGISKEQRQRMNHVVAKQSPLPILQFFLASTTENQVRDEYGNIISPGKTRITTGLQTAPILGGSISVGLPVAITPGSGVFGLSYGEHNNMMELMQGSQNILINLYAATAVTGFMQWSYRQVLNKVAPHLVDESANTAVDVLRDLTAIADETSTYLFSQMPGDILSNIAKADAGMVSTVIKPAKSMLRHTEQYRNPIKQAFNKNRHMAGKYVAGFLIGGLAGGVAGSILSSNNPDSAESYVVMGQNIGMIGTPLTQMALVNGPSIRPLSKLQNKINISTSTLASKLPRSNGLLLSIAVASASAYFLTDSDFGYSQGMDEHAFTRLGIITSYGVLSGSIFNYFGNTFSSTEETLYKWNSVLTDIEVNQASTGYVGKAKKVYLDWRKKSLESDVSFILKTVKNRANHIDRVAKASTNSSSISKEVEDVLEVADWMTKKAEASPRSSLAKAVGRLSRKQIDDIALGKRIAVSGSMNPNLFNALHLGHEGRRFFKGALALTVITLAFTSFAGQLGKGDIEEGFGRIYGDRGLLDWGREQGGILHGFSNVVKSTLKLLTRTDYADSLPSQYRAYTSRYEEGSGGGYRLVNGVNLRKSRNNPLSSTSDLIESADKIFILDDANPFIQVAGPVGFTFRRGEGGTRIARYVQIQSPGADISTASYSIAAAYGFRAALNGNRDAAFNIQNAMRMINEASAENKPITTNLIRAASIQVLSSTAKLDPLRQRRRYSEISIEGLDLITMDPLLSASLNYRKQMMENISHQPLASLGTKLVLDASSNHILSDVGFLKAMFNRDPKALESLLNDRFGLLTRDIKVQSATLFSIDGATNRLKGNRISTGDSAWMEQKDPAYQTNNGSNIPFISAIRNSFNNVMGFAGSNAFGWFVLSSVGFMGITAALGAIGSISLNQETSKVMNKAAEFRDSPIFPSYQKMDGNKSRTVYFMRAQEVRGIGGLRRGPKRVEIVKGNNIIAINQQFVNEPNFVTKLNKSLELFQKNMNDSHMTIMKKFSDEVTDKWSDLDHLIDEANQKGISPKELLKNSLVEASKKIAEEHTKAFLDLLKTTEVVVDNHRISLLTLLAENTGKDEIIEISGKLLNGQMQVEDALEALGKARGNSVLMRSNYLSTQIESTEKIVDDLFDNLVKHVDTKGIQLHGRRIAATGTESFTRAIGYIHDNMFNALSTNKTSSFFTVKNYFGNLANTSPIDRIRREINNLVDIINGDIPVPIVVRSFSRTPITKAMRANNTASSALSPIDPTDQAKAFKKTRYLYGGFKKIGAGVSSGMEVFSLGTELLESVNAFSAYSRYASSYTSGTYTEAQRKSLAMETGAITTNIGLSMAVAGVTMNLGTIATYIGGTLLAGVATAAGVSATVVGGIALAAAAVVLGAAAVMMGAENRKKVWDGIARGYSWVQKGVGNILYGAASFANQVAGSRVTAALLGGTGGLLGGLAIGLGLASFGLAAIPAAAAIGISVAVGAGLGFLGGLLMPNQMGALSRSFTTMMRTIPIVGGFFDQEGSWLQYHVKDIEGSPFFKGTAKQAIDNEFQRHMDLATNDSGTAMASIITSREIYGGSNDETYFNIKSKGMLSRIRPGSQVDPTLQREIRARAILYSHTIVSRYMWDQMVANSSNKREIREAERKYRMQKYAELDRLELAARSISTSTHSRRNINADLKVEATLLNNIVEVNNMVVEDSRRTSKALVINLRRDMPSSSSSAMQIRDYNLDSSSREDIKNKISSANDKGVVVVAELDEERSYLKEAGITA